jgi:hypothetical protein
MTTKLGSAKIAAARIGISVEQYLQNVNSGLKWCISCRTFLSRDFFFDSTTRADGKLTQCKECSRVKRRNRYKQNPQRIGRGSSPRDGDKIQARYSVRNCVRKGKLVHSRTVPCTDCGHIGDDRQHEYDHHLGYEAINHLKVECVCVLCHRKREQQRRKNNRSRHLMCEASIN